MRCPCVRAGYADAGEAAFFLDGRVVVGRGGDGAAAGQGLVVEADNHDRAGWEVPRRRGGIQMIDLLLKLVPVPELRLPAAIRIVIYVAFLLTITVPFVYDRIGLAQRFMFLPWVFFLSAYGVVAWYEQVNKTNHIIEKRLVRTADNTYPYPLYWVFVPLMLYYYPIATSGAECLSSLPGVKEWLSSNANQTIVGAIQFINYHVVRLDADDARHTALYLLLFLYAVFGAGRAAKARVYLNGYWGLHLYEPAESEEKKLDFVKDGPYKRCRHPIYGGQVHLAVATALTFGQLSFLVFALAVFLLNVQRAWREERHLARVYGGDYENYKIDTTFMWRWW